MSIFWGWGRISRFFDIFRVYTISLVKGFLQFERPNMITHEAFKIIFRDLRDTLALYGKMSPVASITR